MGVPNAVKKQAEKAAALAKQVMEDQGAGEGPDPNADAGDGSGGEGEDQPAPDPTDSFAEDLEQRLSGEQGAAGDEGGDDEDGDEGGETAAAADLDQPAKKGRQDWRAKYTETLERYSVLRGKYDAEVPRLQRQVKELEDKLSELSASPPAKPAGGDESGGGEDPYAAVRAASEELGQEWDPELGKKIADITIAGMKAVAPGTGKTRADADAITELEQKLEKRLDSIDERSSWGQLRLLVPEAEQLNQNPEFLDFLDTIDERSGQSFSDLMNAHWKRGDVARTARFFDEFKELKKANAADESAGKKPTIPAHLETPAGEAGKNQDTTARAANAQIKQSEINRFEKAVRKGKWRGEPERIKAMRDRFLKAAAEGRVLIGQ